MEGGKTVFANIENQQLVLQSELVDMVEGREWGGDLRGWVGFCMFFVCDSERRRTRIEVWLVRAGWGWRGRGTVVWC